MSKLASVFRPKKDVDMTSGPIAPHLIRFAIPLLLGNIFQQFYTVVDTAIVGQGVGVHALAALGSMDWFNWMLFGIAQGFSQGFAVRMAQKYGEGDMIGLRRVIGQSALLSGGIAAVFIVVFQLGLPLVLLALRVPVEIRSMAGLYTRILVAGALPMFFFNFCSATKRTFITA